MKHLGLLVALATLGVSSGALARDELATVSIIDRESGAVSATYYHRGEYWVAGRPGARYAIEIRNCTGARLLAVTSVDGVNVHLGRHRRLGAVRVRVRSGRGLPDHRLAQEQRGSRGLHLHRLGQLLCRAHRPTGQHRRHRRGLVPRARAGSCLPCCAERDDPPRARPRRRERRERRAGEVGAPPRAPAAQPRGVLAGRRRSSAPGTASARAPVQETQFVRLQSEPNEVIRIRYDSLENLVAMGIIRRPRPLVPAPNPFPDSRAPQFVPDPPG